MDFWEAARSKAGSGSIRRAGKQTQTFFWPPRFAEHLGNLRGHPRDQECTRTAAMQVIERCRHARKSIFDLALLRLSPSEANTRHRTKRFPKTGKALAKFDG